MPQLDFFTFSNQQLFTLMCLLTLYYYNLIFFCPKYISANNFTRELQLIQILDLNCTYLYLKTIVDFFFFFQKNQLNLLEKKNMFSSIISCIIVNVGSKPILKNTVKNFYITKIIGVLAIIVTSVFFSLVPTPEFLIFWFLIKLVGSLFLVNKIFFLDLIKFEFNVFFLFLKANESSFTFFLDKFLQNLFFVKKSTLNIVKQNIKNGKIFLDFLFKCLSFINVAASFNTKFVLFDSMELKNQKDILNFDDLKPFVRHLPMFVLCFYIIPFVFGSFFVFEGNIFFQNAMSCQMEGIVSLYNYVMFYLTAILFFVTTILFFVVSCGIDGNHYFEIFANNAKLFKLLKSNKKLRKRLQKKLLMQWYIPLFQSMKRWNHSTTLELAWTIIPTIILLLIAVPSFILLYALDEVVDTQCIVKIIAHQWYWEYEYPIVIGDAEGAVHFCTNVSYSSFMVSPEEHQEFSKLVILPEEELEQDENEVTFFSDDFKEDYYEGLLNSFNLEDSEDTKKLIIALVDAATFFGLLESELLLDTAFPPILFSEENALMYILKLAVIENIVNPNAILSIVDALPLLNDFTFTSEVDVDLNKLILDFTIPDDCKINFFLAISNIDDLDDPDLIEQALIALYYVQNYVSAIEPSGIFSLEDFEVQTPVETQQTLSEFNIPAAKRLLVVDVPLVLPHSTNVRLVVTSDDVLHSFAVPALGLKIDAVGGRLNQISLYAYGPGIYHGQCSELCGVKHGFMPIEIIIIDKVSFQTFLFKLFLTEKLAKNPISFDFIFEDNITNIQNSETNNFSSTQLLEGTPVETSNLATDVILSEKVLPLPVEPVELPTNSDTQVLIEKPEFPIITDQGQDKEILIQVELDSAVSPSEEESETKE